MSVAVCCLLLSTCNFRSQEENSPKNIQPKKLKNTFTNKENSLSLYVNPFVLPVRKYATPLGWDFFSGAAYLLISLCAGSAPHTTCSRHGDRSLTKSPGHLFYWPGSGTTDSGSLDCCDNLWLAFTVISQGEAFPLFSFSVNGRERYLVSFYVLAEIEKKGVWRKQT